MSRIAHRFFHRAAVATLTVTLPACAGLEDPAPRLFLDVHHLDPSGVTLEGVAEAHREDLAIEADHGVHYERYWVDEDTGTVYCLVQAPSARDAEEVHRMAHGLVADEIHEVKSGILPAPPTGRRLFMDTHEAGPGVLEEDVAAAHRQDLAVQDERGVSFLEYWLDEASGRIHCLAEAPSAAAVIATHRDAHGLLPTEVKEVVAGR